MARKTESILAEIMSAVQIANKIPRRILVIGNERSGKTALVHKLVSGEDRVPIVSECAPDLGEERRRRKRARPRRGTAFTADNFEPVGCEIKGTPVTIFDLQGPVDDSKVLSIVKTCNIILVCQKLFGTIHHENLVKIVHTLGPEFLKRTIFVFTFGDEYKLCDTKSENKDVKEQMANQKRAVTKAIKAIMVANGIEEEIVDGMPSMISSAVEDSLPTTNGDSWVDELWDVCMTHHSFASQKKNAKLLVIGHTEIGKSSFINKIVGQKVTDVGSGLQPYRHELIVPLRCKINDVPLEIFDSRGLNDPLITDRSIIDAAISMIQTVDVVLICHKLYGVFDKTAHKILQELARALGNDLMKHTIFVFTFGDEYKIRCEEGISKDEAKQQMKQQENDIKMLLRQALYSYDIEKDIVDGIPSIITCGKCNSLPTSDNWVEDFWSLCEERCTPEAVQFVSWIRRDIIGVMGGVVGGTLFASIGAMVGSTIMPGAGTLVGTVVGGVAGAAGAAAISQLDSFRYSKQSKYDDEDIV